MGALMEESHMQTLQLRLNQVLGDLAVLGIGAADDVEVWSTSTREKSQISASGQVCDPQRLASRPRV